MNLVVSKGEALMIKFETAKNMYSEITNPYDMTNKDLKTSLGDLFFALGIFCEFIVSFSGYVFGGYHELTIIFIGMIFFALKILLDMDIKKDWLIFLFTGIVGILCYKAQNSALIIRMFLILLAGRNQNPRKVAKLFFIGTGFIMLVVGVLASLGFYNGVTVNGTFRNESETRYCFGFIHPNGFAFFLFRVLVMFLFAYSGMIKWWGYLLSAVIFFPIMYFSKSKIGMAAGLLAYVLVLVTALVKSDRMLKLYYIVGTVALIVISGFTYLSMICYNPIYDETTKQAIGFWEPINNKFFTGRLHGAYDSVRELGVCVWGIDKNIITTEMGFASALISNGAIFVIIYISILFIGFYRLYKKKDKYAMSMVIAGTAYAFAESFLPYVNKNPALMALIGTGLLSRVYFSKNDMDTKNIGNKDKGTKDLNKKTIKLAFVDFWSDFNPRDNYFYNILNEHFNVEISKEPDYVICSCFGQKHHKYRNAVKLLFVGENVIPDFNLYDYAMGFHYIDFEDRYIRFPLYVLYEEQMKLAEKKHTYDDKHYLDKKEFCSFVVSNPDGASVRDEVFEALNKYKRIASGGRYRNNVGGPVKDKMEFIRNGRFTLAIENSSTPGYTTEKILEAFAAETIPIYWGSPRIKEEFNPDAFINVSDYDSYDELVEAVKTIDTDDSKYLEMIKTPIFAKDSMSEIYSGKEYLEDFLVKVFSVSKEEAFRRNMVYYGNKYQNEMSDAHQVLSVVGLYRKVLHTLSKKKKQKLS